MLVYAKCISHEWVQYHSGRFKVSPLLYVIDMINPSYLNESIMKTSLTFCKWQVTFSKLCVYLTLAFRLYSLALDTQREWKQIVQNCDPEPESRVSLLSEIEGNWGQSRRCESCRGRNTFVFEAAWMAPLNSLALGYLMEFRSIIDEVSLTYKYFSSHFW